MYDTISQRDEYAQNLTNQDQMILSIWKQYKTAHNLAEVDYTARTIQEFAKWLNETSADKCSCCGQEVHDDVFWSSVTIDYDEDKEGNRHFYGIIPAFCHKCNTGGCFCAELRDMADND